MMCQFLLYNNTNQLYSYVYSLPPEPPSRPLPPTLPGHHRAMSWAPALQHLPTSYLPTVTCLCQGYSQLIPPSPSPQSPMVNLWVQDLGSPISPPVSSSEKALNKCLSLMKKKAFSIVIKSQTFWVTPSEALLFSCPTASHNDPSRRTSGSHGNVCDKAELSTLCAACPISGERSLLESYLNLLSGPNLLPCNLRSIVSFIFSGIK